MIKRNNFAIVFSLVSFAVLHTATAKDIVVDQKKMETISKTLKEISSVLRDTYRGMDDLVDDAKPYRRDQEKSEERPKTGVNRAYSKLQGLIGTKN